MTLDSRHSKEPSEIQVPTPEGETTMVIENASSTDHEAVKKLLKQSALPLEGVGDSGQHLLVARANREIVGTVALDFHGQVGLLRSLAVDPAWRDAGLGTRLSREVLQIAVNAGLESLFLLTESAAGFFESIGFEACDRSRVPNELATASQFAFSACSQATCMVLDLGARTALQDLYPNNHCFGCGPENEGGLQLKTYREGDLYRASFWPSPEHNAGPRGWLNGGIIATLIDCHSIFAALSYAYELERREFASRPLIWMVTGHLAVRYRRPVPIEAEVRLEAKILESQGRKTSVVCELSSRGEVAASAEVLAIRVKEAWRNPS